jgi:DNA-binding NtrC family response regulator
MPGVPRILASWIGHADLSAFAATLPDQDRLRLLTDAGINPRGSVSNGPVKTLVTQEAFDEIHLVSNYPKPTAKAFARWIGSNVSVHEVRLDDPTDYAAIFRISSTVLSTVVEREDGCELCIHLSPGTPAMTAIWVLLGKSRFPAKFFQTHDGRAYPTEIPFDLVVDFLPQALRNADLQFQHLAMQAPGEVQGFEQILGDSASIRIAVGRAQRAAIRAVSVLITGESGTGKEMFARAIHNASSRRAKPFVALNCAALPRDLLESELFGHKKGSFTGAIADRAGAFEQADGGTIFLDEIGECPPDIQAKLLRVLQPPPNSSPGCRMFRRVGDTKDQTSDVRMLSATNRSLPGEIAKGSFREDLYYRLAVITLALPALRDRPADLKPLAKALLAQINIEFAGQEPGYRNKSLSVGAISFVQRYRWPGNVRQLQNALVQAAVMSETEVIGQRDLEGAIADAPLATNDTMEGHPLGDGFNLLRHLESIQAQYLQRAMLEAHGVKTKAAQLLGIANYQTLDAQLKRLKISVKEHRS